MEAVEAVQAFHAGMSLGVVVGVVAGVLVCWLYARSRS